MFQILLGVLSLSYSCRLLTALVAGFWQFLVASLQFLAGSWQFVAGFLAGVYFWHAWTNPREKPTKPGLRTDITLEHSEELELYYNEISYASQKVSKNITFRQKQFELPGANKIFF